MTKKIERESIISELQKRNYNAVPNDVIKNGVLLNGITIKNETNIAPTIYIDKIIDTFDNINDIVEYIINTYESNKSININISHLTDREWILKHLYIALQKTSNEQLIKRNCEFKDIEQFLYIREISNSDSWSAKLNLDILQSTNITIKEAWTAGEQNTFSSGETVIESMAEIFADVLECPEIQQTFPIPQMYVITNKSKVKGSVQIFDKESIRKYFPNNIHRLICIPSSIHEFILIPTESNDIDFDRFNKMIEEVNSTQVDATEQLGSQIYILEI